MLNAKRATAEETGRAYGYRSGLEEVVQQQLRKAGVVFEYEKHVIKYEKPARMARNTPDFVLENGIIFDTKGRFVTADRQKVDAVKKQHPDLDVRMVFSNPNSRISKASKTTYAAWCDQRKIPYAKGLIPTAWLNEPRNVASIAALKKACNG